jgi:hypothetical protein
MVFQKRKFSEIKNHPQNNVFHHYNMPVIAREQRPHFNQVLQLPSWDKLLTNSSTNVQGYSNFIVSNNAS